MTTTSHHDRITAGEFHAADGVEDWRVVFSGACAHFSTESFAQSAEFVTAIARLATLGPAIPQVDIRDTGVTVRLGSYETGLEAGAVPLARSITALARERGFASDPSVVQHVQLGVAHPRGSDVLPFWLAALNYRRINEVDILDPQAHGPSVWFMELEADAPRKRRLHVDVSVPHDQAEARVAAAVAAGGRVLDDSHAPAWWTLVDAQGHYIDIATWQGREQHDD